MLRAFACAAVLFLACAEEEAEDAYLIRDCTCSQVCDADTYSATFTVCDTHEATQAGVDQSVDECVADGQADGCSSVSCQCNCVPRDPETTCPPAE